MLGLARNSVRAGFGSVLVVFVVLEAGKTSNLSTMWETLGKKIFLDPPVPIETNVYLGSSQTPVEVPLKELQQKFDTWKGFFHNKGGQTEPENAETASVAQSHGQDADQRCPIFASLDSKELNTVLYT